MDLCHRDGSLKQAVAKDPAKYIHKDQRLAGIMEMYRAAGKKLFVATNSLWDYTHVVMNYLLTGRVGSQRNEDWLEYFDVVITGQRTKNEAEGSMLLGIMIGAFLKCNSPALQAMAVY